MNFWAVMGGSVIVTVVRAKHNAIALGQGENLRSQTSECQFRHLRTLQIVIFNRTLQVVVFEKAGTRRIKEGQVGHGVRLGEG